MASRLEEIKGFIKLSPSDPFPRYGLAMEHKNLGQNDEALAAFEELGRSHPDYVAQYLMHGNLLAQLKRTDQARAVYQAGIAAAQRARNHHAAGELRAALEGLDTADDEQD